MKRKFSFYLFHVFFLYAIVLSGQKDDCTIGTATIELSSNNLNTFIRQGGFFFTYPNNAFIFPQNTSTQIIGSSGLWIGGIDATSNLKFAAQDYYLGSNRTDYYCGPLNPTTGETDSENCDNWDRFFVTPITDIEAFIADWDDNGTINDEIAASIKGWPSTGNPYFYEMYGFELPSGQSLAPFVDLNGNQLYEPENGDYPDTKGATEAIWWVFNDAGGNHVISQGEKIRFDCQVMAYSYSSNIEAINNAIFYDLKFTFSNNDYIDSTYIALWFDFDFKSNGCYLSEKSGCKPSENLAYVYLRDSLGFYGPCAEVDNHPMLGIKAINLLSGDENENLNMSSFVNFFHPDINNPPSYQAPPNWTIHYYRYISGLWKDGTPYLDDNNLQTSFQYPDSPSDSTGWSMCTDEIPSYDSRILMSFGPLRIVPGSIKTMTFAIVGVEDVGIGCPDLTPLEEAVDDVEEFYNNVTSVDDFPVISQSGHVEVIPNPVSESAVLKLDKNIGSINAVQIFSATGELIWRKENIGSNEVVFEKNNIPTGLYFYKITAANGNVYSGKFLMQ